MQCGIIMNNLQAINFHGTEIPVVEKGGKQYVAMKPIVEAMGLDWSKQLKIIKNDPVLNSTVDETSIVAEDRKERKMICLPLSKLNGWLFKIDANRYKHDMKRFNAIVTYQNNCYDVLFDYFHKGGAINPAATDSQVKALLTAYQELAYEKARLELEAKHLRSAVGLLSQYAVPDAEFGDISKITGLPRDIVVKAHLRSCKKIHRPRTELYIQLRLPLSSVMNEPTVPDSSSATKGVYHE